MVKEKEKVEKGREGLGSAGTVAREVCPLLAINTQQTPTVGLGAGEGGASVCVDGGEGAGLQRTARVWGRQDESYPPQLMPWVSGRGF